MKETIKKTYYFSLLVYLFIFLCSFVFAVLFFINRIDFIHVHEKIKGIILIIFILIGLIILTIFSLKELIKLMMDYKAVKAKKYIEITGKVLEYKRNRNLVMAAQMYKIIVLVKDTNETIQLFTYSVVRVGQSYKFNYLKNSKIAEAVGKYIE